MSSRDHRTSDRVNATGRYAQAEKRERDSWPDSELAFLFDDRDDRDEVTLFPATDKYDISTHWVTINAEAAIDAEDWQ